MLQIDASHRSVRYNTDLPPPFHSKLFLQVLSIASNFDKGWRGDHKHKIMDRPFMPKYGTMSQVLFQLVVVIMLGITVCRFSNSCERISRKVCVAIRASSSCPARRFNNGCLIGSYNTKYL